MEKRFRVLRWLGLCVLGLLASRGAASVLKDLIIAGMTPAAYRDQHGFDFVKSVPTWVASRRVLRAS